MTLLSRFVVASAIGMYMLISQPVIVCAESHNSIRPPLQSAQPISTPSVKNDQEAERGRRGRLQTQSGATIGEIEDFLIEPERGCIAYSVLTRSGRNTPDDLVIVPWELMQLDPGDPTMSSFRLPGKQNLLGAAPQVSRVQWRTSAVTDWLMTVGQYWASKGIQPCAIANSDGERVIKASDVVGMDIHTDSGSNLGTIRELIMDGERGVIASVVVAEQYPSISIFQTFFALPWTRLHLNTSRHIVIVHLGAQTDL